MTRRLDLPPRPSGELPAGVPLRPGEGPALWDGERWSPRSLSWLGHSAVGVERLEVYMADEPEGATLLGRLTGGRFFVAVFASAEVLRGRLASSRSLRGLPGLDEAVVALGEALR